MCEVLGDAGCVCFVFFGKMVLGLDTHICHSGCPPCDMNGAQTVHGCDVDTA